MGIWPLYTWVFGFRYPGYVLPKTQSIYLRGKRTEIESKCGMRTRDPPTRGFEETRSLLLTSTHYPGDADSASDSPAQLSVISVVCASYI
jgi:hypothetical protein